MTPMNRIRYPEKDRWPFLCQRPVQDQGDLLTQVQPVLEAVRENGDQAVLEYTARWDGVQLKKVRVPVPAKETLLQQLPQALTDAIQVAYQNIWTFHQLQMTKPTPVQTMPGVTCWRKALPIERVGLYVPGGTAPLFSSLLMLGIPARIAGCSSIVVATPPSKKGTIDPTILYVARLLEIDTVYAMGGAQAVAAMAYGTQSVPKVDKIFGPGNQYVTAAKQLVQQQGLAIDMPAGPSEVLVIADGQADPEFVAADLLSQAEHGPDSQVILVSDDEDLLDAIENAVAEQLEDLPRKDIAWQALSHSRSILLASIEECIDFSNQYAPEHLILNGDQARDWAEQITNAGSVFIGPYSCESAGDYASGTNHTLPTNGYARAYSGVSVDSFVKQVTFQELSAEGLQQLGPAIETMAAAEQLAAHERAVSIRLQKLQS